MKITVLEFDADAREADILITDGSFSIVCFAPDCEDMSYIETLKSKGMLMTFLADNIYRVGSHECSVIKNAKGYYSYDLIGKRTENNSLTIGSIGIIVDKQFPCDIAVGEYVRLSCCRVDYFLLQNNDA